jgi:anti-anti-sigma factor
MSTMTQLHSRLEWNIEAEGDVLVARLSGSADFHQVTELDRLARAIAARRGSMVVLDLSELEFISSVGLGAFISLKRSIEAVSGKLMVAGLNPAVAGVFHAAGLDRVFETCASVS